MKINLENLGLSLSQDEVGSFTDLSTPSVIANVDFGDKIDNIVVNKCRVSKTGTIAAHSGRFSSVIRNEGLNVDNALIEHLNVIFNRKAFSEPNRLMLEEAVKSGADDGESNVFSHRTRVHISNIHMMRSDAGSIVALNKVTLSDPMCIRYLAKREKRENLLALLASDNIINDLVKLLIGTSGRAKTGTKRFTIHRMVNWLRQKDTKKGAPGGENLMYVVGAVILRHILEQFDWEFASLETVRIEEVTSRLLDTADLEAIYTEGWLFKTIPTVNNWVMKYEGASEVTASALFEVLSGSVVALRQQLMTLNLLHRRFEDVVNAAKVACALNHGLVEDIANETLLAFVTSSAAVQDMAGWSCIALDLFSSKFSDIKSGVLSTKVGDISLLRSFADELVAAVRSHPLIDTMSPSDYVRHVGVRHYTTEDGLRYHTAVYGNIGSLRACSHFIEASLGSHVYGVTTIRENKTFNDEVAQFFSTVGAEAIDTLAEVDSIHSLYNLSTLERPEDVVNTGCHGFSAINVHGADVMLLALMQNEVLVRYRRNLAAATGVAFLDVLATYFVLHNVATSAANPFPVFDDAVYTQSCVIAVCMGAAKEASGSAPLLQADVSVDSAAYVVDTVENMIRVNRVSVVPNDLMHSFTIVDLKGTQLHIPVTVDLSRYLTLSAFDTTKSLISRDLELCRALVEYALTEASVKINFDDGRLQYSYDLERLYANFLSNYMRAATSSKFARAIMSAMRFDAAVTASGPFGSLSNAVHNIALNNHCVLFSAGVPAMVAFNSASANPSSTLRVAFENNRLFKDFMMNFIVKGYNT